MSSVAARPDVKGTVEQVMSGELFSGLLLDDTEQRALALETVLGKVVDDDTRVIWIGNPLRSPLTMERFLIQIVGPEIDLRVERGPAELARIISNPVGHESRMLIVVQQPETINAETLHLLVQAGWYLGGQAVQVQFLFAGSSAFVVPRFAQPEIKAFSPTRLPSPAPRRRDVLPLLLLLLTLTIGVLISMAPVSRDPIPQIVAAVTPPPMTVFIRSAPATPPVPEPAPTEVSPLKREFDSFLAERASALPPMTDGQKDALFNDFLTHHRRE